MRNRANRLEMPEPRDPPAVQVVEDTSFGLNRGMRRSREQSPHLPIPFGGPATVTYSGTRLRAGTDPDPRCHVLARRKGRRARADLRDDLLSGVDAEAGDRGKAFHRGLVRA